MSNIRIKLQSTVLVLFIIFLLPFVQCTVCGPFDTLEFFDIQGIDANILDGPHFTKFDTVSEGQTISRNNLVRIYLTFDVNYIAQKSDHCSFGNLLACDPPSPGKSGSKTEIFTLIEIKTLTDYSETYKAGSLLNKIFKIENYRTPTEEIESLILLHKNIQNEFLDLRFTEPPTIDGPKQFEVNIILNTGEIYNWISPRFITLN